MSDTRYPTRMHEVLGVEAFERFQIKGLAGHFFLTAAGQICPNEAGMDNNYLIDAINRGIIRKPRLSEEQVAQLRALLVFGMRWLASDKDYYPPFAYQTKPKKEDEGWYSNDVKFDHIISVPRNASICDLVSWSDSEPLDIVATLKAAGVEVE